MHLIVTDLPVPEPPMMTSGLAASIVRSTPSSTTLEPKRFLTPLQFDLWVCGHRVICENSMEVRT